MLFTNVLPPRFEIIYNRADADKEHMGLTSWKNSPHGKIVKSDVSIAKNYLTEDELENLELLVNVYLDLAERHAKSHTPVTMEAWVKHLDLIFQADIRIGAPHRHTERRKTLFRVFLPAYYQ
jgi:hypothetical protein